MSEAKSIDDLFGDLLELKEPAERQAFLKRIGGEDSELCDQLGRLLAAHEQAGSFLQGDETCDIKATANFEQSDLTGTHIGPYRLRERIGEGGMGVVYVAEQERPLRRKVALKVIKPGMDSKAVLARFDAERNALALIGPQHYFDSVGELAELAPSKFEERLFRGFAYSFGLPARAQEDLQAAVELKRTSAITRALHAEALHRRSLQELNPTKRLELAERAAKESEIATEMLPRDSAHALVARMNANIGLLWLQTLNGKSLSQPEVRVPFQLVLSDFEKSRKVPYDSSVHVAQLDAIHVLRETELKGFEFEDIQETLVIPDDIDPKPEAVVKVVQQLYHYGKLKKCDEICSKYEQPIDGYADFTFLPQIEYQLQNGVALSDVKKMVAERSRSRSEIERRVNGCNDWVLLKLLEEDALAEERARTWLEFCNSKESVLPFVQDFPPIGERMCGTGTLTDEQILSKAEKSATKNHVAFWLGIDALTRGEREVAKKYFTLASRSTSHHQYVTSWGAVFAKRAEDETWLPWLNRSQGNAAIGERPTL